MKNVHIVGVQICNHTYSGVCVCLFVSLQALVRPCGRSAAGGNQVRFSCMTTEPHLPIGWFGLWRAGRVSIPRRSKLEAKRTAVDPGLMGVQPGCTLGREVAERAASSTGPLNGYLPVRTARNPSGVPPGYTPLRRMTSESVGARARWSAPGGRISSEHQGSTRPPK